MPKVMPERYTIVKPDDEKTRVPVVFDSPHSGTVTPPDFKPEATKRELEATQDKYVDDLFETAPDQGATLLKSNISRAYIDLNRAADDIDPALLKDGKWDKDVVKSIKDSLPIEEIKPTTKSAAGIGLIRRLVKPGTPVYERALSTKEIMERIENYYRPYHQALLDLLNEAHYDFGQVFHINCHSMPSSSAVPKRALGFISGMQKQTDFCIGNKDGKTAGYEFTDAVRQILKGMGYTVTINDPYKGVSLIGNYASPMAGRQSIQLEINRALYMNEDTLEKNKNYNILKKDIHILVEEICKYSTEKLRDLAAD